jgi:bis(5'-nucleosidyl)-tetraphosphatase
VKFEKSCGVVIYRHCNDTVEFLTVRSKTFGHWGFPKGHVEEGESEKETAKREVLEETGLDIALDNEFRISIEYSPMEGAIKEVVFFMGEYLSGEMSIQQEEIQDYKWLNYSRTFELLTFDNERKVLTEVKEFIV